MRSSLHGPRVRRELSGHWRRAEWAIEQRKQNESGDKAADMSDPGDRHVGKTQRLSSGAENEVRSEPDQNEDERPTLHKDAAEARSRNRLDLGTTGRAERPKRRSRLKHEPGRRAHEAGIRSRSADERGEIHRRNHPMRERAGDGG